ncbi:ATP-binding protein [Paraflavisolibacter sp. H34]|uniref:GAF domain-containing sensor histidine kinase n=1 Tax=Huijunlia imazamoxiresistens TaxID=3127457 RepID=UPI00301877FF
MIQAALPDNETQRLQELQSYHILDTEGESDFDQIAELASLICNSEISLVSLVDKDRQWFKAHKGLGIDETPREVSFCAHAILQDDVFIVEDAQRDERFWDNSLVTGGPHIRFYAGAPIISEQGHKLGTVCAIDKHPRQLTPTQKEALEKLSRQAAVLLEFKKQNAQLKQAAAEQQRLAAQAERLNEELFRSNEDLQRFAHVVSHDLKEPVRKVLTFGERLQHELNGMLTERSTLYLSKIREACHRMHRMVEGVLQYSSLNAREAEKEPVDLSEVMDRVEGDLELKIAEKVAVIERGPLPVVTGSPVLLYQLFYNLVNNSLKFVRPGVPPRIKVHCTGKAGGFFEITLQDNGIGFEQEQAEKIFQSFTRLHSKSEYEGTGLGLSLCKSIVERHGGTIRAEGKEGAGATFYFSLPE